MPSEWRWGMAPILSTPVKPEPLPWTKLDSPADASQHY